MASDHSATSGRQPNPDAERKDVFMQAVTALREGGDRAQLADALVELGRAERNLGQSEDAAAHYAEAADVLRSLEVPLKLAHVIRHVGDILRESGQTAASEERYAEALAIYRQYEDERPLDLANALRGYALTEGALAKTAEGIALWREAGLLYAHAGVQQGVDEAERHLRRLEAPANQ